VLISLAFSVYFAIQDSMVLFMEQLIIASCLWLIGGAYVTRYRPIPGVLTAVMKKS